MGAYLSRPNEDKVSEDHQNNKLKYGVSSMQGWRREQEDSYNCILNFDKEASLFAVYDGHGGAEVAIYTSEKLPDYIKETEDYKKSNYKEALVSAFLNFDDSLLTPMAITRLKEIRSNEKNNSDEGDTIVIGDRAQCSYSNENGDDKDEDEDDSDGEVETDPDSLRREATKPLEEVMASYFNPHAAKLISGDKPASPYLRGRRDTLSSGECSSSYSGECSSSFVEHGGSASECSSSSGNKVRVKKLESNGRGNADVAAKSPPSNGKIAESSSAIKEQSSEISGLSKCKSDANGSSSETLVNGTISPMNGDVAEPESSKNESPKGTTPSQSDENPSCSTPSKKKKLALTDLEDSEVVKSFITSDEIDESDEEDSEDETFRIENVEDSSDDDDEGYKEFVVQDFVSSLQKRLCEAVAEDDDDDDEDEDEDEDEEDEDHVPSSSEPNEAEEDDDDDEEDNDDDDDDNLEEDEDESLESSEDNDDDRAINVFGDKEDDSRIYSGCTAVVALIKDDTLYVANAGDSRCVICKNGLAIDMSEDHKPEDEIEHSRIIKAGGEVTLGRVNGGLNLSRAIGDHEYKQNTELSNTEQMVIALPDVRTCKIGPDVEFIVLACDGIWNSMSSQEVVNFIKPELQANKKLSVICEKLFDKCLARNTRGDGTGCDNMTCIIVKPLYEEESSCDKIDDTKTATSSVDTPSQNTADSSRSEDVEDKNNEAVSSESVEEAKIESKSDGLSSISQKRCADSTEDDEIRTKRQKTETDDSS